MYWLIIYAYIEAIGAQSKAVEVELITLPYTNAQTCARAEYELESSSQLEGICIPQ